MAISLTSEKNQVLFEERYGVRKVTLNRPKKLNSLNYEMIYQLLKKLKVYENDPMVNLIILKGHGKTFCVGGDVTGTVSFITTGHWSFGASIYRNLLSLDYLVGTYKKPLVAIINGAIMGAGVGLTTHARFRIVTENTVFAMPEASIGLFPNVGASHFLSRLPGFFGEYLGLTGARLDGSTMVACGLATHFILSKSLPLLENEIDMVASCDVSNMPTISEIINKFAQEVVIAKDCAYYRLEVINKCFSGATVEEILYSLEDLKADKADRWIIHAINSMKSASPISLKVFLRSIREGRPQNLQQCLVREFNIFCHFIRRTISDDFFEGSRAMLIDKDMKPQWMPSKLELVDEEMVGKFFSKLNDEEWEPLQLPPRYPIYNMLSRL